MTDGELLAHFIETGSQPAFTQLVERHYSWVSAVARRRVRGPDAHLAEDVTQAVFILLAQKAKTLRRETVLSAWLFQATRYCAMAALRGERRRRRREEQAAQLMRQQQQTSEADALANRWEAELAPQLDELVEHLSGTDRRAVLLRFYEQKTFSEVGRRLGISEEAARKRVERAVDKLATMFGRRGVTVSATLLASAMVAHVAPSTAAAGTIAATTATAALTATSSTATSATAQSAAALLAWAQVKAVAAVVAIAVSVAAVGGGTAAVVLAQVGSAKSSPATSQATTAPTTTTPVVAGRVITGRVLTPDGKPVGGAVVHALSVELPPIAATARTDDAGGYRITLPAGSAVVNLLVDAAPWAFTAEALGEQETVDIVLKPPTALEVTAIAPDGHPAAGVPLSPRSMQGGNFALASFWSFEFPPELRAALKVQTDAAGKAVIPRLAREARVIVEADDDRFAATNFDDTIALADGERTVGKQLKLADAATVSGRLTFPDGRPAAAIRVAAQSTDHSKSRGFVETVTDTDGRYRLARLRGQGDYNIIVDLSTPERTPPALLGKWTSAAREKLAGAEGQQIADLDLQVIEGVELRGRVIRQDDRKPVAGIHVGIHGPARPRSGAWVQSTVTNDRGEFVTRVPPGKQHVYVMSMPPEGYQRGKRSERDVNRGADGGGARGGAGDVELAVEPMPGKPVSGRVVDANGRGVAGATVFAERPDSDDFFGELTTKTSADGGFAFKAITPKTKLRVIAGRASSRTPVTANGGEAELTITVRPAVKIDLVGSVTDENGNALPHARVALTVWNGSFGMGSGDKAVDAAGRYHFSGLDPDKDYRLEATAPGYGSAQLKAAVQLDEAAVEAAAAAEKALPAEQTPMKLKRASSFVSGTVVDEAGRPVADILVHVDGRSIASRTTRTDANGRFEFADLVEGEKISLNAFAEGYGGPQTEVDAGSVDVTVTWKLPREAKSK